VASGTSYAAKVGETDDLVMATLLVVRMLQVLQEYHKELDDRMRDHGENMIEPLPFVMTMG
jgi:cell division protein ZapA (FtsZ GTPase activity inhibitor)